MSNLRKARIHSVDSDGTIIEDVDVYTSGDAVTLNNGKTLEKIYENEIGNVNQLNTDNKVIVDAINENTYNLAGVASQVKTISDNIESAVIAAPSVNYGMNNVINNTGRVSVSPKFVIQGKTVINLLGKDGNCEDTSKWNNVTATTNLDGTAKVFGNNGIKITLTGTNANINNPISKYNLDISKYYLFSAYLKNGNATSIKVMKDSTCGGTSISSSLVIDTSKFNRVGIVIQPADFNSSNVLAIYITGTSGQYAYVDGIMINEITTSEYTLGAAALLDSYPYVDSYACLQNPYFEVKHDNLIKNGNGEEGINWWTPYDISKVSLTLENGKFKLVDTNPTGKEFFYQKIQVKPNTNYYVYYNVTGTGMMLVNTGVGTTSLYSGTSGGTFNSGQNSEVQVAMYNYSEVATTIYFDSIMLIKGTTAPVSYKPCIVERVVLEGKFTSDDSIAYSNGQVTGSIWWKHRTLYGRDYDWFYDADFSAFKRIRLGAIVNIANTNGTSYVVSNDGMIIKENTSCNGVNQFANNNTGMYITASDSDTGWLESVNPNSDEVKAFMNGWKAVDYFTTTGRYCTWQSIIDNSFPSIAVQTTALATSTGTTATIASAVFSAGDSVGVFNSAGAKKGAYNVASVSGNTLTFTGSANVSSGDILVKNDSNIVSYCKKNVAPGYEGYQLHYKLQNPEPTTDINCHVHGDIPKFDVGDNYLYLDSGIVLDEVANYSVSTSDGGYNINYYGSISSLAKSPLINKVESINTIYKNSICDNSWIIGTSTSDSYGNTRAWNLTSKDLSATYTVDYKILATQSPQVGTITCSYGQDIVGSINSIEESLNNKQNQDSILDSIIDLSLYERQVVSYNYCPWYSDYGTMYFEIVIYMMPKKAVPIIAISNVSLICGNASSNTDCTSKCTINAIQWLGNRVRIRYQTSDASVISSIKSYGIQVSNMTVIADCRNRT